MFRFRNGENNTYFKLGLTVFLTVIAILTVYDALFGAHKTGVYINSAVAIITPILYGCAIAYLLSPIVDILEHTILKRWAAPGFETRKPVGWVRVVSVLITFLILLAALGIMLYILLPEVGASFLQLIDNIPGYAAAVDAFFTDVNNVQLPESVMNWAHSMYDQVMAKLDSMNTVDLGGVFSAVSGGVVGVVGVLSVFTNLVVGIVVAAYMLGMKERLAAQCKKIVCALCKKEHVGKVLDSAHYIDDVFGGFIRGNILVSTLIGVICFVALEIMGIPYAPLLAVLLGVTNLIPFFGPFLGAIPSCILIFLVSPIKCLYFIIFILILQQLDGNILTPRILGQSTGLASLWVIVAILIGGGLFGPIGMLLGCPAFAIIYTFFRALLGKNLRKKNMPLDTDAYRPSGLPDRTVPERVIVKDERD